MKDINGRIFQNVCQRILRRLLLKNQKFISEGFSIKFHRVKILVTIKKVQKFICENFKKYNFKISEILKYTNEVSVKNQKIYPQFVSSQNFRVKCKNLVFCIRKVDIYNLIYPVLLRGYHNFLGGLIVTTFIYVKI